MRKTTLIYQPNHPNYKINVEVYPPRVRTVFMKKNQLIRLSFPTTVFAFNEIRKSIFCWITDTKDDQEKIKNIWPMPLPSVEFNGRVCMGDVSRQDDEGINAQNFVSKFWLSDSIEIFPIWAPNHFVWAEKTKIEPLSVVNAWVINSIEEYRSRFQLSNRWSEE